jgi:amino acid transporter
MVFAILAFIGFEAAAPLGEEARNPRRTVPRAIIGSALAIGIFYVLCSYAWVFGAGFDNFVTQATGADPWRNLGKVFWGTGWIVIFLAICNSIAANSNAAMNAATRVFYALGRNGLAPKQLAKTHDKFKTPSAAIIWLTGTSVVISLLVGWKWNPGVGFGVIATLAVPLVVLVYMLASVGCIVYYLTVRRAEFNPLLHVVLPIGGIVLFFFPLYYQFYKVPPPYPFKYANWVALGYTIAGILVTIVVTTMRPDRLKDLDRVYLEDQTDPIDSIGLPTA